MSFISNLKLHNFRNYERARLGDMSSGLIVLSGPNGAGKTNILEAVSMLSPGRGLRGAKVKDMQSCNHLHSPWAISADLEMPYGPIKLGTGLDSSSGKRVVRINGEPARGQSALAEYFSCVWLTPQMDRLFLDSSSQRRRFLDRLIFTFDPGHAGRISRYENALSQRSKILKNKEISSDPLWLSGLESQMAETGIAIAAARLDFVERLQKACNSATDDCFPMANLWVSGVLEELLGDAPALEVEELFKAQLEQSRGVDMLTGGAATGPHKSDFRVAYAAKNMPADQCSTGEQKALLIGIILAHACLIEAERGQPPALLLDEVAAHLDGKRRSILYELLEALNTQVWLTGTEGNLFYTIQKHAQFFRVQDGRIIQKSKE